MMITLPSHVFDAGLPRFIDDLLAGNEQDEVVLDFRRVTFFIPGAVVGTVAIVKAWQQEGKEVRFRNHDTNPNCGYLQRIDFFKQVGFDLPENGTRRDEAGKFIPVEEITGPHHDVESLSCRMAECISPGGFIENHPYQMAQYACGEIVTNCKQHSRGIGFASAQYAPTRDFARISVADCGRGILKSFAENGSNHYTPLMTDQEAIEKALQPRVSSTTHIIHPYGRSPNKGIGLSMVRHLMQQTLGHMVLISGQAFMYQDGNKNPEFGTFFENRAYQGTLCAVAFKRGEVINYREMRNRAQRELGLTEEVDLDTLFV